MAAAFRQKGTPCEAVHGQLPDAERERVLRRFEAGEIQVGACFFLYSLFFLKLLFI